MSFRKRNTVVLSHGSLSPPLKTAERLELPGTRPSPLDGRITTSTGTRSLDVLFAGHAGLAMGTSLLIEEAGSTDFGGALLRYYAAEGLVQGHHVHVLGMDEAWARDLPGLTSGTEEPTAITDVAAGDKMKIAWRYERLGEFKNERGAITPPQSLLNSTGHGTVFCHDFDLSKRLAFPNPSVLRSVPIVPEEKNPSIRSRSSLSPFTAFLQHLSTHISATSLATVHRVVIPNLLSPATYPHTASMPHNLLQFLHSLRALLRNHSTRVTTLITFPLSLHPRTSGLTRWIEILSDGVLELAPFPSSPTDKHAWHKSGSSTMQEETPQGMLKVHRQPIFHEKGGGSGELGEFGNDLAFNLSRRRGLIIKPYSLPPVDGGLDSENWELESDRGKASKRDIEF